MDGDEGLDASMFLHKVHNGLDLHFRVGKLAVVSVRAGVVTSSGHCGKAEDTAINSSGVASTTSMASSTFYGVR